MKKLISAVLAFIFILSFAPTIFAEDGIIVHLNGVTLNERGTIVNDRTYLPVRALCEALGYSVDWISDTKSVIIGTPPATTYKRDTINIFLNAALLENTEAIIIDGRTYLPVRAISEALGMEVLWDSENRQVYVKEKVEYPYPIDIIARSEGFLLLAPLYRQRFLDYTTNNLGIGYTMRQRIEQYHLQNYQTLSPQGQKDVLMTLLSDVPFHRAHTGGTGTVEPEGEKAGYSIRAKNYYRSYDVWKGETKPVWIYTIDMEIVPGQIETHSWSMISTVEDDEFLTTIIEAFSRFPYALRKFVHRIIYDPGTENTYYGGGNTLWLRISSYMPSEKSLARDLCCVAGYVFDAHTTYNVEIWKNAINDDFVSVSKFGNTDRVSDIGEFVSLYHSVKSLDNGLEELEKVYPNRFAAHAAMLYVADSITYAHYKSYYAALLKFDDPDEDVIYYKISLPGTQLVLTQPSPEAGTVATFEEYKNDDSQLWSIRQYKGKQILINKKTSFCLQIYLGSKEENSHFVTTSFSNRQWQHFVVSNVSGNAYTFVSSHSNLYLTSASREADAKAIQARAKTYLFMEEVQ